MGDVSIIMYNLIGLIDIIIHVPLQDMACSQQPHLKNMTSFWNILVSSFPTKRDQTGSRSTHYPKGVFCSSFKTRKS